MQQRTVTAFDFNGNRVTCLSYACCCWRSLGRGGGGDPDTGSDDGAPTVLRLARVLGDVFYPLNFSFTDIVAAITLVGITHRSNAHGSGSSSHRHAIIAAAAAGIFHPPDSDACFRALAALDYDAARADGGGSGSHDRDGCCAPPTAALQLATASQLPGEGCCASGGPSAGSSLAVELSLPTTFAQLATAAATQAAQQRGRLPAAAAAAAMPAASSQAALCSAGSDAIAVGAEEPPQPPPVTAMSSEWARAVLQGSALAVRPGCGLLPGGPVGAARTAAARSSEPGGAAAEAAAALGHHQHRQRSATAVQPCPPPRPQSWAGGATTGLVVNNAAESDHAPAVSSVAPLRTQLTAPLHLPPAEEQQQQQQQDQQRGLLQDGEAVEPLELLEDEETPVSLELLEEALHWHRYANAIYGWPMYLWSHRYRRVK
jgi:hypothetical protein